MSSVITVNPFRCRMWALHDRIEEHVTAETCRTEIESFLKHGQLVPVLGRPAKGDPDFEIELIYGARRLFVAKHLNKPLTVEVRDVTDREGIIAMDIENRQRVDVSPYERGMGFAKCLRLGVFASQEDLAHSLKISPPVISRLLKLARLPAIIIDAFGEPSVICESWGTDLTTSLEDPARRQATLQVARRIAAMSKRPAGHQVYKQLLGAGVKGGKLKMAVRDDVVCDDDGRILFRIRQQLSTIAVLIPAQNVSAATMCGIRTALVGIFRDETAQATEYAQNMRKNGTFRRASVPQTAAVEAELGVT